ncbi:hypothetical protein [Anatilimnocola floriformis]|uniref:hypothetical protein n=1 Tax=Anatilimnocola floriformis TaxID=2948575 RepID=UPI0020C46D1C|nr:hypothetical protein [Anatilimnocola floriformis]
MAAASSRESQGLQIAVIIFAVLTIVLAVTTYVFYAQAETAKKDVATAQAATTAKEKERAAVFYQNQALKFVIGYGNIDRPTVMSAKPVAGDPAVDEILAKFDTDMAMYAAQVGEQGASNYVVLPNYLLGIITNKQFAQVDSEAETRRVQAKSVQDLASQVAVTKVAEDAKAKAETDLRDQTATYTTDRAAALAEKDRVAGQLTVKDQLLKKEREESQKTIATISGQLTTMQGLAETMKKKVLDFNNSTVNRFESPDGRVTLVNQAQRLVWINLGQKDGLQRQTTFSVFNHDENGVAQAEPKARLEVVRIVGDHLAECRILEDKPANPILQNDVIFTPAWSPGVEVHFALVGFMDINKDSVSDREMIRNVIKMSGGIIDAELQDDGTRTGSINVNTRYLVLGEKPNERSGTRVLAEYNFMLGEVNKYGTETINVQKLMSMMGYKPEERKVELGTNAAKNEFKKRGPGGAAAPAGGGVAPPAAGPSGVPGFGPPAANPMGVPMPMAPVDDPFK